MFRDFCCVFFLLHPVAIIGCHSGARLGADPADDHFYHTGSNPLPLVVGLACEGFEARLKAAA